MKLPEFPLDVARVYFQLNVEIKLVPIKVRNSPANKDESISRYKLFLGAAQSMKVEGHLKLLIKKPMKHSIVQNEYI